MRQYRAAEVGTRPAVMLVRPVELRATTASLALAEEFGIARGSRTTQSVVRAEVEHEGIVGPANHAGKRDILIESPHLSDD